jgi:hypothetical protein
LQPITNESLRRMRFDLQNDPPLNGKNAVGPISKESSSDLRR